MATFENRLQQLEYIHQLIAKKKSGSYGDMARKLRMSKSNIYRICESLRGLGADIAWDNDMRSYYYRNNFTFNITIHVE